MIRPASSRRLLVIGALALLLLGGLAVVTLDVPWMDVPRDAASQTVHVAASTGGAGTGTPPPPWQPPTERRDDTRPPRGPPAPPDRPPRAPPIAPPAEDATALAVDAGDAASGGGLGAPDPDGSGGAASAPSELDARAGQLTSIGLVRVIATQRIGAEDPAFFGLAGEGDRFGSAVAGVGDLNGDGYGDLAIGAPFDDDGALDTGALWIVLRDALGVREAHRIGALELQGVAGGLLAGETFGFALASLGPGSAPGRARLAVGAPGRSPAASDESARGRVWILEVDDDGDVLAATSITQDGFEWSAFGTALASAPGGAYPLLVGARWSGFLFPQPGAVFRVTDGTIGPPVTPGSQGFAGETLAPGDRFGSSIAVVGDLDADGQRDWVVAAEGTDAPFALTQRDGLVLGEARVPVFPERPPFLREPAYVGTRAVAHLPDVDGDGHDELVVGARTPGPPGTERPDGVWLILLGALGEPGARQQLDRRASGFAGDVAEGDELGAALASPGDLGRDGRPDLAVGAPGDGARGAGSGAVWLLHLEPAAVRRLAVPPSDPGFVTSLAAGQR